jgi:RNA polymerase sigma factor FliA
MNAIASAPDAASPVEPRQAAAWRAYQAPLGAVNEDTLIERYLPLVRKYVDRVKMTLPPQVDADDLYSVGVAGLLAAVRRFDPAMAGSFVAYASTRIRGAILDELRRMDCFPRRARAKARKIKEAIASLEQRLGRAPSEEETRQELGLSPRDYEHWMTDVRPVTFVAIDEPLEGAEGGAGSLHEIIRDEQTVPVQETLEKAEAVQIVTQRLAELPDVQRKVLAMYYHENMRLAEIAAVFGLTESRICQIHSQAVLTLRAHLLHARDR